MRQTRFACLLLLGACTAEVDAPVGSRYYAPDDTPKGAVILLHGSEGGDAPYSPFLAQRLSRQGLAALAFCWFGCAGRPDRIENIPIERVDEAIDWVRAHPDLEGLKVGLYGGSRGAELAMLYGSQTRTATRAQAIAIHAGTDTVVAGYDPATNGAIDAPGGFGAAWTYRGAPLYGERALPFGSGPRIEIENYPGPFFASHGEDDELWPVQRFEGILRSRQATEAPTTFRRWPNEGHVLSEAAFEIFENQVGEFFLEHLEEGLSFEASAASAP